MRISPLDARHRARGAKMVEFGGWDMPIQYGGVLEEHRACREDAVVFDVSHLGTVECTGPDAHARLQWLLTNDLGRIEPGKAQYTHLLDPDDAHVVDDIIAVGSFDRFFVMPNANTNRCSTRSVARHRVSTQPTSPRCAVLAVQGPHAPEAADALPAAAAVPRFAVEAVGDWIVAGTGYTGEDGVEIHVRGRAPRVGRAGRRRDRAGGSRCSGHPRLEAGLRCTGTSSARGSRRCRPAWAGWSAGQGVTSGAGRSRRRKRPPRRARRARASAVSPGGRARPSRGAEIGSSPAATSRRRSDTASHSVPAAGSRTGAAVDVDVRETAPATVVATRSTGA